MPACWIRPLGRSSLAPTTPTSGADGPAGQFLQPARFQRFGVVVEEEQELAGG